MTVELDLSRLDQVAGVLGTSVPDLVAEIVTNLTAMIDELRAHIERAQLDLAAKAAHTCRNEALLLAARPLLPTLTAVEQASRNGRLEDARAAQAALDDVWPATRQALAEIAARPR